MSEIMAETITLELSREQATAVMQATELLARLEIGQFKEISWHFIGKFVSPDEGFQGSRRDHVDELLEEACAGIFGRNRYGRPDIEEKSVTHKRCWAVYSTIRHVLAWHDHPEGGITVNFDKPLGYGEPMPKCRIEETEESK